jgi:HEAT repeat protein
MNARERVVCCSLLGLVLAGGCESREPAVPVAVTESVEPAGPPAASHSPAATPDPTAAPPPTGRAAEAWGRLNSPDVTPQEWEHAQTELIELGAESVPVLVQALEAGDPMQREMAVTLLMQLGPDVPGVDAPVLRALEDSSPFVRANAATALSTRPGHEERVIPVLTELLSSDDPQLRQMAAMNLSNFGPEAAACVPQLSAALSEAPPEGLLPIVELLGRIGPAAEAARPQLQQIAFEQEGDAREAASAALQRISGE